MVHDSDSNATKPCFVHVTSGGQTFILLSIDPSDPVIPRSTVEVKVSVNVWTPVR